MAIQKPAPRPPITQFGDVVMWCIVPRDPATGIVGALTGTLSIQRVDAAGNVIDEARGTLADLSGTQQNQIANIMTAIRTYADANLKD